MEQLAPKFEITIDKSRRELHFAASGYWDEENVKNFLNKMAGEASIFLTDDKPFSTVADFRGATVQSQESAEIIRMNLEISRQFGLTHIAVIGAVALVKLQFKRLSDTMTVEFFDTRHDALHWLRAQHQASS